MKEYLRRATMEDCDLIYKWANDKETRSNSFHTELIPYKEHVKWYSDRIKSKDTEIFILLSNTIPVGQIRVDYENEDAILSFSVDKNYRHKGYGRKMLELVENEQTVINKTKRIVGRVKYENNSSRKCFLSMGYIEKQHEQYVEYVKIL